MTIQLGQDALGRWAWMIVDARGRVVASDDNYGEAALAMEGALNELEMRELERRVRLVAGGGK